MRLAFDRSTWLLGLWVVTHAAATFLTLLAFASMAEAHRLGHVGVSVPRHSHGEIEIVGFGLLFIALAAIEVARAAWARRLAAGPSIPDHSDL